jgi:hypothetical protein
MKLLFRRRNLLAFVLVFALIFATKLPTIAQPKPDDWVAESNQNAQVLIEGLARFSPEGAGQLGAVGLDEQILDIKPGYVDRQKQIAKEAIATLQGRLAQTTDAKASGFGNPDWGGG